MPSKQSEAVRRRWEAARLAMAGEGEAPDDESRGASRPNRARSTTWRPRRGRPVLAGAEGSRTDRYSLPPRRGLRRRLDIPYSKSSATGLPLPAAALLMSPVSDLEVGGESYDTNRDTDPLFHATSCAGSSQQRKTDERSLNAVRACHLHC